MSPRSSSGLRRWAPVLVVLAVQGVLVGLVPSTAPGTTVTAGAGAGAPSGFQAPFAAGSDPGTPGGGAPGDGTTPGAAGPGSGSAVPSAAPSGGGATPAPGQVATPGGAPKGDTGHCVQGRQFDPAIDFFAPPCVPRSDGKNAGATYAGVTATAVKIVDYYPKGNAAVDSSLQAQGLYVSIDQQRTWDAAAQEFVNSHYELYGRKVEIKVVQGSCDTIPPDTACLRTEMKRIAANEKPFAFRWITPLTSAPFDELSALGVVNVGGQMFMDSFSDARRPYHWDVHMSGTRIADHFGEWWCKQLHGQQSSFSAATTPDGTAGNTNARPRVLGIIGTNDPENIKMRQEVDRVLKTCGDSVAHTYDASNDLSTAASQKSASVASMRQAPEATTVLCLCNPVGAQFVYNEMQTQSYYPEIVYAGTVYTDLDDAGQGFMSNAACPTGSGCTFADALGLSSTEPREPVGKDTAQRVWNATGRTGPTPFAGTQLDWEYVELLASLIQGAGPNLTPSNLEQGAFAAGSRGGGTSGHALRAFGAGSHAWNQDMQLTYWAPTRTSPFNAKPGTFVPVGPRTRIGGYAQAPVAVPKKRT